MRVFAEGLVGIVWIKRRRVVTLGDAVLYCGGTVGAIAGSDEGWKTRASVRVSVVVAWCGI
jgi:hypothetical protein